MNKFFKGSIGVFSGSTCIFSAVCPGVCNAVEEIPEDLKEPIIDILEKLLRGGWIYKKYVLIAWSLKEVLKRKNTSFDEIVAGMHFLKYLMAMDGPMQDLLKIEERKFCNKAIILSLNYVRTFTCFLRAMKRHEEDFKSRKFLCEVPKRLSFEEFKARMFFGNISEGLNFVVRLILKEPLDFDVYEKEVENLLFTKVYEEKMGMWRLVLKIIKKMQEISKEVYNATNMRKQGKTFWSCVIVSSLILLMSLGRYLVFL